MIYLAKLDVPFIKQKHDDGCGPANAAMVLQYCGCNATYDELYERMPRKGEGISIFGLMKLILDYAHDHQTDLDVEIKIDREARTNPSFLEYIAEGGTGKITYNPLDYEGALKLLSDETPFIFWDDLIGHYYTATGMCEKNWKKYLVLHDSANNDGYYQIRPHPFLIGQEFKTELDALIIKTR